MRAIDQSGWSLFCMFFVCTVQTGNAQSTEARTLRTGDHVRFHQSGERKWSVGLVDGITPDTIFFRPCGTCAVSRYALRTIRDFQVDRGLHTHVAQGFAIGALSAAVISAAAGEGNARIGPDNGRFNAIPIWAVLGGIAGGIVGFVAQTTHWVPVASR